MLDAQAGSIVAQAVVIALELNRFYLDALAQGQYKVCFEFGRHLEVASSSRHTFLAVPSALH